MFLLKKQKRGKLQKKIGYHQSHMIKNILKLI